jgi:hypothetical protein
MSAHDWLSSAFEEIAREDASASARLLDANVVEALRARRRSRRARRTTAVAALVMAAVVITAVAVRRRDWRLAPAAIPSGTPEIATAFLPLTYAGVPSAGAEIIRVELPRASLATVGLLPVDGTGPEGTVQADVIVGEDGLARAIRFVRVPKRQSD